MNLYKLLSVCLMYPSTELQAFCQELLSQPEQFAQVEPSPTQAAEGQASTEGAKTTEVSEAGGAGAVTLKALIERLAQEPLVKLQEDYVQIFDMNSKNSLYIFEHIHGDDKERGQALVNLKEEYERHGFTIEGELPDYIPAFLEFLSVLDKSEVQELVNDTAGVMALLEKRLRKAESVYAAVFATLVAQASVPVTIPSDPEVHQEQDSTCTSCSCD